MEPLVSLQELATQYALTTSPHLVVVDDDASIVTLTSAALRVGLKARVTTFTDPSAALAAWPTLERVDLLLVDFSMPGMTGLELAKAVRARTPAVPVVMLSAVEQALASGELADITATLTKPCPPRELVPKIHALLTKQAPPPKPAAPSLDDLMAKLRASYRQQLPQELERFDGLWAAYTADGDARALREFLHRITGTTGSYGLKVVHAAGQALHAQLKEGPVDPASARAFRAALAAELS
jgi:CheY-like chemotaxis protein